MKELRKFYTPDNKEYYINVDKDQDNFEEFVYTYGGIVPVGKLAYNLCGPNSVFFDIGANIGTICIPIATKGTTVHAFDILPQNISSIKTAANASNINISTHEKAIYHSNGVVNISGNSAWGHVIETGEHKIESVTLDSFCEKNNIKSVDVIKIDIEGSELAAFRGAKNLLKHSRPDIIFESNVLYFGGQYSYQDLINHLMDIGYGIYRVHNNHLSPFLSGEIQTSICCDYFATFTREDVLRKISGFDVRPSTMEELAQEIVNQDQFTDIHRLYTYLVLKNISEEMVKNNQINELMKRWALLPNRNSELECQLKRGAGIA